MKDELKGWVTCCLMCVISFGLAAQNIPEYEVFCTAEECVGIYYGPEFIAGDDVAHQLSNKISAAVGDQLKKVYAAKKYAKVDFSTIEMTTIGMGSGTVEYKVLIPFMRVSEKCQAYTSFDHVGGWNHTPALNARISQLSKALLPQDELAISNLKKTPEGLEEYWIQWRNKSTQADCK